MKIAHLSLSALPSTIGGLEVVVDSIIRHQRKLGHDAHLITRWLQWRGTSGAHEYPVHSLVPYRSFSRIPFRASGARLPVEMSLAWHQFRNGFDCFHIHWLYPTGWLAERILRRLGVPAVFTAHGADIMVHAGSGYGFRMFPSNEARLRRMAPQIAAATAISSTVADEMVALGIPASRIHRVPNGVEFRRFRDAGVWRDAVRRRLGVGPGSKLVLSVGRNQASKGFSVIPRVLQLLCEEGRDVVWCIIGRGVGDLEHEFERLGQRAGVRLIDAVCQKSGEGFPPDEMIGHYAAADVFAFPSMTEGFGLVAVEAMAAGLPVVGNDVGGIRDVIQHEENGVLVVPGDAGSMAKGIARVMDDEELATRLRSNGWRKALSLDWSAIVPGYIRIYEMLCAGR